MWSLHQDMLEHSLKSGLFQKILLNIFPSNTLKYFKYFKKFTNQREETRN